MRPWRRSTPTTDRDGHRRVAKRVRERASRDGGRGGSPAWHLGADPGRRRRRDRLRRGRADPPARPPSRRHDRRAGRSRSRRRAGRRDPPPPGHDATSRRRRPADRRRRLPGPAPRLGRRARPGDRGRRGARRSTSGPTSASATRPTTRAGTASSIRIRSCSRPRSTGCPSSTAPTLEALRDEPVRIVGAPGLLPDGHPARARAARPGGAHRRPRRRRQERRVGRRSRAEGRAPLRRGQRERPGLWRRRPSPRRRDRAGAGASQRCRPDAGANPGAAAVDFLPHLIPMNRGILATCHVRPTRPVDQDELDALYAAAYADEPFVEVVAARRRPATSTAATSPGSTSGSTSGPAGSWPSAVIDNLVKGAAGQAVQAFNIVHGLPETARARAAPARAMSAGLVAHGDRSRHRSAARAAPDRPPGRRAASPPPGRVPRPAATAAGIKASGRPDLAIVASPTATVRRPRRRSSPRTPSPRPRSACRRPTSPGPSPAGDGRSGWARAVIVDERQRQCRDGRRRRRRPGRRRRRPRLGARASRPA